MAAKSRIQELEEQLLVESQTRYKDLLDLRVL